MKTEILIFIGPTNAGKTTFSKKFEELGYVCFHYDCRYRDSLHLSDQYGNILNYIFSVHSDILGEFKKYKNRSIVYEGVHFLFKNILCSVLNSVREREISFIVFDFPFQELWKRLRARVRDQNRRKYRLQMYCLLAATWLLFKISKSAYCRLIPQNSLYFIRSQKDLDEFYIRCRNR
ncbi:MAG TPA: hypothetical protein PL048_04310 [Leptospiraceae bacterium]|nr:hypothetical protein [Leptospiraceae bacterium]HMY67063.1 hypothetical protein [Leptospiraceae bacterium]HMZ57971.1 hypothetical protein [Leptospiraceae bacterium]HNF14762.1 hypothetical protein [Leptospiraceae bacterium]HNF25591.1 hypothetical protein [Leptospiraceae bacterium]